MRETALIRLYGGDCTAARSGAMAISLPLNPLHAAVLQSCRAALGRWRGFSCGRRPARVRRPSCSLLLQYSSKCGDAFIVYMHHGTNGTMIHAERLPSACQYHHKDPRLSTSKAVLSVVSNFWPRAESASRKLRIDMEKCRRVAVGKPCHGVSYFWRRVFTTQEIHERDSRCILQFIRP